MVALINFNKAPTVRTPEQIARRRRIRGGLAVTGLAVTCAFAPKAADAFYGLVDKGRVGVSVDEEKSTVSAAQIDIQPEKLSCDVTQDYKVDAAVVFGPKIGGKKPPMSHLIERTVKYDDAIFGIATCWDDKKGDGTTIETEPAKKGDPYDTTVVTINTDNLTSIVKPLERNATTEKGALVEALNSGAGLSGAAIELACQPLTLTNKVSIGDCRDAGNWLKKNGQQVDSKSNDTSDKLIEDALVQEGGRRSWATNIAPATVDAYKLQAVNKTGDPKAADFVDVRFTKSGEEVDINDPKSAPSFENQALDSKKYIPKDDPNINIELKNVEISEPDPYKSQLATTGAAQ